MEKIKITNGLSVFEFDQNDYVENQKKIYDDINKILESFDYDKNLTFAKEYLDNLNGDIFLNGKKFDIFVLKQDSTPICFLIFSGGKIDLLWTHFDFCKLGYATILLRVFAIQIFKKGTFEFSVDIDAENLIADNLFDSFSKIEDVKILKNFDKNGKKTYRFDIKSIKIDQIFENLQKFAI